MTTVVEINGGTLVAAYKLEGQDRIILVDWDDAKEDGLRYVPVIVDPGTIEDLPEDTLELLRRLR